MSQRPISSCSQKRQHHRPQQVERGHLNGHRKQDLQQHHMWKTIKDNQQTRREMPIWIHNWICIPRWHINNQDISTSKIQAQPSNMDGICIPSQGLQHLQSRTTHRNTRKIWCSPKTTLSNQMHVQQKHSQAHHWQGGDIHLI